MALTLIGFPFEGHRVTHTLLSATLVYMVLVHERLESTDLSSLPCFWYGAAPLSPTRLEEALTRIGPVTAQLFIVDRASDMVNTGGFNDYSAEVTTFVTARIGIDEAPMQVEVRPDLPRSKVGKVLKTDIKQQLGC